MHDGIINCIGGWIHRLILFSSFTFLGNLVHVSFKYSLIDEHMESFFTAFFFRLMNSCWSRLIDGNMLNYLLSWFHCGRFFVGSTLCYLSVLSRIGAVLFVYIVLPAIQSSPVSFVYLSFITRASIIMLANGPTVNFLGPYNEVRIWV